MPLTKGWGKAVISKNISEMEKAGHPAKVSIAAALSNARKSGMNKYSSSMHKKDSGKKDNCK